MQPRSGGVAAEAQPWWQHAGQAAGNALGGLQQKVHRLTAGLQRWQQEQQQQQQQQHEQQQQQRRQLLASTSLSTPKAIASVHQQRHQQQQPEPEHPGSSSSYLSSAASAPMHRQAPKATTKEDLGRATWVLLHTLAAQFPEQPNRQQQKDARQLVDCLTRIYPCGDCAKHFQEVVRANPPVVTSGHAFRQWMCAAHNTVNRSIGKPVFNCNLVGARWSALDCGEEAACDMTVGTKHRPR